MNENDPRPTDDFFSWDNAPVDEPGAPASRGNNQYGQPGGGNPYREPWPSVDDATEAGWAGGVSDAAQTAERNRTILIAAALVAVAIIVASVAFALIIRDNRNITADREPAAVATPSEQSAAQPSASEPAGEASSSPSASPSPTEAPSLEGLSCASAEDAAQKIVAYANADGASPDTVTSELSRLSESCDPAFTLALSTRLGGADVPGEFRTVATSHAWWNEARPAPAGAIDTDGFGTPSGNISCRFTEDKASCSINTYDWAAPEACTSKPATISVGVTDKSLGSCGTPVTATGTLGYGQTAQHGAFACTSEESGLTCWSTLSGRGFTVSRSSAEPF